MALIEAYAGAPIVITGRILKVLDANNACITKAGIKIFPSTLADYNKIRLSKTEAKRISLAH